MEHTLEFNKNEDKMIQIVGALQRKLDKVYEGGGKTRIAKEHEKGKMTARERIDYLLDYAEVVQYVQTKQNVARGLSLLPQAGDSPEAENSEHFPQDEKQAQPDHQGHQPQRDLPQPELQFRRSAALQRQTDAL